MGPLDGIKVLDLSMVVAGPFCTMILGDLGADVIKIEPPEGDVSRIVVAQERGGVPVGILNWNRNKRAMVLDLKRPGAAEVFLKMAEHADVVIQNVRPGVVDRLGVGYEAVAARNPKIVYCSMAGYGFKGPYRDKPAYDPIIQGLAGVMATQRTQGRPRAVKNIIADKVTAMTAAIAILAALNEARTGKGQHIEIAMIDAVAYYLMGDTMARHTFLPHKPGVPPAMGTLDPFKTADSYITIAPLTDKHWTSMLAAIGRPELFAGDEPRSERVKRAIKALIDVFPTQTSAYWLERIEKADVPCGAVNDFDTIWNDPQFVVNETFVEYEHPQAGRVRGVRSPARFSKSKTELWRHAPGLGQHTDEILKDFGFAAGEVARLREERVVK
ncbi:MAG TPA: CaiB/BaiF CoA-transferase family protein [Candidatus Binataceae bacterium]|nr:CaiB/BaiF CoA-transferase family protein [Candidatus Binataceae bacterium]